MKVGVSGPLLSHFGLNVGLLVLPVLLSVSAGFAILVGSFGLGAANFFVLVALSKLVAVAGRSSTFEPSFRVLYQPIGPSERIAYQSHVEGTARQISIGAVGLALLLFSRSAAFNALNLFYLLVPILGPLDRGRDPGSPRIPGASVRRVEGADQRRARSQRPLDVLMAYLRSNQVDRRRRALRVIERIEPGALPVGARSARSTGSVAGAGRRARMRGIVPPDRSRAAGRGAGDRARSGSGTRSGHSVGVDAIVGSARAQDRPGADRRCWPVRLKPADRHLAAVASGTAAPENADRLSVLLWDRDARVRQAALAAAGRLGNPEFRPMLVRHLGIPMFASAAAAALVAIGAPAVTDLERAFGQANQTAVVRRRILQIFRRRRRRRVDGAARLEAGFAGENGPAPRDRAAGRRRLSRHAGAGPAGGARRRDPDPGHGVGHERARRARRTRRTSADVRDAVETELAEGRRWLFDLLSLVYDPGSITAVREIVEVGSPQAMVHALEILDLLISAVLKPFVFPLLEGQSHLADRAKSSSSSCRASTSRPTRRFARWCSRDYGRIGVWTRAVALDRLGRDADGRGRGPRRLPVPSGADDSRSGRDPDRRAGSPRVGNESEATGFRRPRGARGRGRRRGRAAGSGGGVDLRPHAAPSPRAGAGRAASGSADRPGRVLGRAHAPGGPTASRACATRRTRSS